VIYDSVYLAHTYPVFFLPGLILHNRISNLSPSSKKKFIKNLFSSIYNSHNSVLESPINLQLYVDVVVLGCDAT
jgi:hypothetical protein